MRNTIIIAAISLIIAGCSKVKFSTTPILTFKSVNTKELRRGESIQFKLHFTDLEGDLKDSIYVEKVEPSCVASSYKTLYPMPAFPKVANSEGDIIISYTYGASGPFYPIGEPGCSDNDTCTFRFALQDEAKHKSDTVTSDVIIIYK